MKIDVILESLDAWIEAWERFDEWAKPRRLERTFGNFMSYLVFMREYYENNTTRDGGND